MILQPIVIEKQGRSVEEAKQLALMEAGCSPEHAVFEVIEEANSGLFGLLGKKQARVRLIKQPRKDEVVTTFLKEILQYAQLKNAQIRSEEHEDAYDFAVEGDDLAAFIGRHGQTLDALQYLCNLISKQGVGENKPIHLDVAGYRKRRREKLEEQAERMAEKARRLRKPVVLQPMSAQDRRVIHIYLQNRKDVVTESTGQEPHRKVTIKPIFD